MGTQACNAGGLILLPCRRRVELAAVGLIRKLIDSVRLVDEALVVVLQPVGNLGDRGGGRVLRLAAAAHG